MRFVKTKNFRINFFTSSYSHCMEQQACQCFMIFICQYFGPESFTATKIRANVKVSSLARSCLHKIRCSVQVAPANWSYSSTRMSALLFAELLGNRNIGSNLSSCALNTLFIDTTKTALTYPHNNSKSQKTDWLVFAAEGFGLAELTLGTNLLFARPKIFFLRNPWGTFRDIHW